ncbi:hypothetical protein IQ254_01535 [Nodosilinea sp. LEGE 07088]|uniref:hypothetical protein n=1 Tax=Nodosilinea sp. LEGE 07088 TaxID=2777968 RepID=UPI001881FE8D|nr:hypothetical protein [Nodosilinea sp. LEGE 07088]MBE9135896.1 hypothetical protein [Nodosilinea sp. LEGE 07088]
MHRPRFLKSSHWSPGGVWTAIARWTGLLCLHLLLDLGFAANSAATTWYPVAAASQGQQQQFVDIDSIELLGSGQVRVGSYYIDRRTERPQRTDYLTEYDCLRRRFRDVAFDGPVGSDRWQPVDPDPLNSAAMDYVCAIAKPGPGPIAEDD